ncbi:nucleoside 5-triphosphatase RdgB [Cutibacterium acnes JCM 18909]|nr:nucleoside 5-triphosphatase RdgB [Cutibacterium acnes JCM 18909]
MSRIVLASNNAKKLVELRRTFEGAGTEVEIVGLSEVSDAPAPEETGRTFVENASSRLVLRPAKPVYLLWLTTPDSRLTPQPDARYPFGTLVRASR